MGKKTVVFALLVILAIGSLLYKGLPQDFCLECLWGESADGYNSEIKPKVDEYSGSDATPLVAGNCRVELELLEDKLQNIGCTPKYSLTMWDTCKKRDHATSLLGLFEKTGKCSIARNSDELRCEEELLTVYSVMIFDYRVSPNYPTKPINPCKELQKGRLILSILLEAFPQVSRDGQIIPPDIIFVDGSNEPDTSDSSSEVLERLAQYGVYPSDANAPDADIRSRIQSQRGRLGNTIWEANLGQPCTWMEKTYTTFQFVPSIADTLSRDCKWLMCNDGKWIPSWPCDRDANSPNGHRKCMCTSVEAENSPPITVKVPHWAVLDGHALGIPEDMYVCDCASGNKTMVRVDTLACWQDVIWNRDHPKYCNLPLPHTNLPSLWRGSLEPSDIQLPKE